MIRVLLLLGAVSAAVLAGACSGNSTSKRAAPPGSTATSTAVPATSTTSAPASTCGPTTSVAKSGGSGDVTPPGDIPDNQAFVVFDSPTAHYSIKTPEGWARSDQGGATTFTDKLNAIRIEVIAAPSAPSPASAQAELPNIRSQNRCFEGGTVTTVQRRAGPAVLLTYRADGAPDPVTGKVVHDDVERYEFWRAGNEAVITLSSPQGSDNVDPWRLVTDSFTWTA